MEGDRHLCPNCGVNIEPSAIDFKTRRASCTFCGKQIIFPKRHSTASPSAVQALSEAYRFFSEKNFTSAKTCAETAVSLVNDNMCALYIIAYYSAFVADIKSRKSYDDLFRNKLADAEFEIEEEDMFKELLIKTILHSCDYEQQILIKLNDYDDAKEVAAFVEKYCPFTISRRASSEWLTPELVDVLAKITRKSLIPKTWYALLTSVSKIGDSPLATGHFYLRTKASLFYNNYLMPIGNILNLIPEPTLKMKFMGAFSKVKQDYEAKLNS